MIPLGCSKPVYFSNEYIKSYECNLLGISDQVKPSKLKPIEEKITELDAILNPNSPRDDSEFHFADLNEYIYVDLEIKPKENSNKIAFDGIDSSCLIDYMLDVNDFTVNVHTNVNELTMGIRLFNR